MSAATCQDPDVSLLLLVNRDIWGNGSIIPELFYDTMSLSLPHDQVEVMGLLSNASYPSIHDLDAFLYDSLNWEDALLEYNRGPEVWTLKIDRRWIIVTVVCSHALVILSKPAIDWISDERREASVIRVRFVAMVVWTG